MHISKVIILNFRSYLNPFSLELEKVLNTLVGNNETGKSTILEIIHLSLHFFSYFTHPFSKMTFHRFVEVTTVGKS